MKLAPVAFSLCLVLFLAKLQAEEKPSFERLVVQRSGGAGIQETYEITADGKFKFSDLKGKKEGQLLGDDLLAFAAAVNKIEWAKLPKRSPAKGPARFKADQFQYSVAIVVGKTFYNLSFHESAFAEDQAMKAFLAALAKLK